MITFRSYRDVDLDAVAAVWIESQRSTGLGVGALADRGAVGDRIIRELAGEWRVTVACDEEAIVGFLSVKPARKALDQLFVAPAAMNKGVGTELLNLAISQMPDGFELRTAQANHRACQFYEKRGLCRDREDRHPALGYAVAFYVWRGISA